jgi:addiction module HigA family antidote
MALKKLVHNPHAGEILKAEFLDEIGMSQNALALAIHVPSNRIHDIVRGRRSVTADTDLRLSKFFGLTEGYFLRLQMAYDLLEAKRSMTSKIAKIKPYSNCLSLEQMVISKKL